MKKVKIVLELETCKKCPYHKETAYPTDDNFERPTYWWCINPNVEEKPFNSIEEENRRLFIKNDYKYPKLREVEGYINWYEEKNISIPNWCPIILRI